MLSPCRYPEKLKHLKIPSLMTPRKTTAILHKAIPAIYRRKPNNPLPIDVQIKQQIHV